MDQAGEVDVLRLAVGTSSALSTTTVSSGSVLHVLDLAAVGGVAETSPNQVGSGSLVVQSAGLAQIDHKLLLLPKGLVQVTGGGVNVGASHSPPTSTLLVSAGGILAGKGKVIGAVLAGPGGTVIPGGSDGTLAVQGNYTQSATSELSLQVAGPVADSQYDLLNVTGIVTLAGKLILNFINGFAPAKNQSFDLIKFGASLVGQFDQVQINGLAAGFQYHLQKGSAGTFSLVADNDGVATSAPPAPLLSLARTGSNLVISWPPSAQGYHLQSAPQLDAVAWTNVPGSSNPFTVAPIGLRQFFRLTSP